MFVNFQKSFLVGFSIVLFVKVLSAESIKTRVIRLGQAQLTVEIADTPDLRTKGLMYRTSLKKNHGMLFVFKDEQSQKFWMKNTIIPLSIAFADSKKTIFQIGSLKPVRSFLQKKGYDSILSSAPAKYAIEVAEGWFKKNNIVKGTTFSFVEDITAHP